MSKMVLAAVLLLTLSLPRALSAQAPDSLTQGARVRVKTPDFREWRYGQLVMLSPDSAAVELTGATDTLRFARGMPGSFEWSRGLRPRTGKGAALGFGIGAGLGLILGIAASAEECTGFCPVEVGPGEVMAASVILGGIGAGFGALIGMASRGESWKQVDPAVPAEH